ncbi:uncharacterized protein LOC131520015 [Neofelis nebulosa]|uniref:uncharacterized protein LOC131520015 n=1 Tax=Neofelis nebulosa TaxID=61452 RepID=UPI00272D352A|nr:uncharacterized protein LOC131520015 [Neofelis nebulosa]
MPGPGSTQRWAAAAGRWSCRLLALLLLVPGPGGASEITFELPDNAKQCFYEDITQGTKCTLEFQVITGGHYDVDCRLEDPDGNVLYKEMKKQYDSFTFTASKNGTYKFCFSNEFSTFTHKTVYFDFQVGEDPPLFPSENRVSALTQMESACVSIHEALKSVIDYQTHFRLREAQGRSRAEDLNTRVAYWSVGEALILLVVSIGQVFLLKSFFSDKRTTTTRVGSVSWGSTIQNAGLVIEEAAGTEDPYAYLPKTHIRHFALFTVLLFNVEDPFGTLFCWGRGSPPLLTWMLIMGVGKSKIDPCPLSLPWGKSPSVDMSQRPHDADSKKSNDISLRDIAERSHGALTPSGEREGTEAAEEVPEEDEEEVFLKFVILHAEDDTDEALRVQNLLQNDFGIKPGIIFAEMPCGRQHLQNLDDAVNGSAWTILLLTENFLRDTWCKFQFYTSLMNSVNRQHKYNSVIPLRPLNNPLPRERTPFALRTINALEEESRGFPTQVERIFQESVYKIQQSIWKETRTTLQRHSIA